MAYSMFGAKTVLVSALLACACGSSSDHPGAGGASHGVILGNGGDGSEPTGTAGSEDSAGANNAAGKGSGGSNGSGGAKGSAGSGSSGAENNAGAPSTGSTCPVVTPCGGDPVGEWTIKQQCITLDPSEFSGLCPGATVDVSDLKATGTVSFKADQTVTSSGNVSFKEVLHFPTSCFGEAQCAAAGTSLTANPDYMNGRCDYDAASGCTCSVTVTQEVMSSGTYNVQGTKLVGTSAVTGASSQDDFCVSGNTLSIQEVNANGSTATLILTK